MPNLDPALWTQRTVGTRSTNPNWTNADCVQLTEISHVTHVGNALEIVRANKITAGLVYDESTLNTTRTTVVWVSPNDWSNAGGSRYGNVQFVFDWENLQKDLNAYQIEVQEYTPPAYRILLTDEDHGSTYPRYHPERSPGPWRLDKSDNTHHWNGKICLEVMIEASINLDRCIETRFCTHHPKRCCIDPNHCANRGFDERRSGSLFVAGLIARNLPVANLKLTESKAGAVSANRHLRAAWQGMIDEICGNAIPHAGPLDAAAPEASAIARGVMSMMTAGIDVERDRLCGMFKDQTQLVEACAQLLERHFGISAGEHLKRQP